MELQVKNIKLNENGTIDCELLHKVHGWIPFTADKDDIEEHGREIYKHLKAELDKQKND